MDVLLVLPLVVGLWSAVFVAQVVTAGRRLRVSVAVWLWKVALIGAVVGAGAAFGSEATVYAGSAAWAVFLAAPALLAGAHARALAAFDYPRAQRLAWLTRALHPFDAWRREPALLDDLARLRSGDVAAADDTRRALESGEGLPATRIQARFEIARATGDWDEVLSRPLERGAESLRLRALGEVGRLAELVTLHGRAPADPVSDLMLMAFGGRRDGVEALVGSELFATLSEPQRDFWRGTAALLADPADARARALIEAGAEGPQRATLVARRLDGGLAAPETLPPDLRAAIDEVEGAVLAARAEGRLPEARGPARAPVATWALIAVNVAAFGAELWFGGWDGPTDLDLLYDLGALWPPAVLEGGQWSRLVTAPFLHYGALHLALNMLALLVFGPLAERRAGRVALLALYAVSGVGSMAGSLAIGEIFGGQPTLLVGASGAIFGVLGGFAGLLLRDAAARAPGAWRGLRTIAAIVVLQAVFDFVVPQVSFAAHACGFALGLPIGLMLGGRRRRR